MLFCQPWCRPATTCCVHRQALPVGGAVLLQYSSCLVSREAAYLHQLSGKHFSHRLTLQRKRRKKKKTIRRVCHHFLFIIRREFTETWVTARVATNAPCSWQLRGWTQQKKWGNRRGSPSPPHRAPHPPPALWSDRPAWRSEDFKMNRKSSKVSWASNTPSDINDTRGQVSTPLLIQSTPLLKEIIFSIKQTLGRKVYVFCQESSSALTQRH